MKSFRARDRRTSLARDRSEAGSRFSKSWSSSRLIGIIAAMAMMVSPAFTKKAKADAGISQAMDTLRLARETAISQRRNVRVVFVGLTAIRSVREDIGAGGVITGTTTFARWNSRTACNFGSCRVFRTRPTDFGRNAQRRCCVWPSPTRMFTSEGNFVNQQGDLLNGTLFLAIPSDPNSRAGDHHLRTDGADSRLAMERPRVGGVRRCLM